MSDSSYLALKPMAMRRAPSYEDFAGDPTSKFRALDLGTGDSFRTCAVWRDRAFLDQTAFKDEPPVKYENCGALFELLADYEFHHSIPFRNSLEVNPLKVISPPQSPSRQVSEFSPFAEVALAYFNSIQNDDFKLIGVTHVGYDIAPKSTMHVNFDAESVSGKPHMFYAELKTPSLHEIDEEGIEIRGCAMLEKVDTGNPLGFGCSICGDEVIHPGPKDGYNVVTGDQFKDSSFWRYCPLMDMSYATIRRWTVRYMDMYIVCAKKAVEHLNRKVEADWELLEVIAAIDRLETCRKAIHMNLRVKASNSNETELCFVEVFLPLFHGHSPDNWTMEKEPFLEVSGCCVMKKDMNYESPLGRVCFMCKGGLIHPGPKYGYQVLAGDDFAKYDFKSYGNGIF